MTLNSIAFRLFAASVGWMLVVLPLAGFLIYSLYRDDVQASFDSQLKKLVTAINIDSMEGGSGVPVPPTNRYEPLFEVTNSGWYWQIKPIDGQAAPTLVSDSLATASLPSPFFDRKFPSDVTGTRWMNIRGPTDQQIRIVEVLDAIGHEAGQPRFSILVAGPLDWLEATNIKFRNRLTTALTIAGLLLAGLTFLQVKFGLLPLRRVEQRLSDIRSGDAQRLDDDVPVEIGPLKDEINALIQSNQDIVDRARTQVGNLAHALKTPLAVITNEANDTATPFSDKVRQQANVMRDQIGHYLDRARMAARVGVIGQVTIVGETAMALTRALERIHQDRGIKIHVDCDAALKFQGERQDLEEMLGNLLDNACKFARANVWLSVEPTSAHHDGRDAGTASRQKPDQRAPKAIVVVVEDDGPGLTPAQRQLICKRGLRLDESKPGSGLGLSIVTDLAHSYQGSFTLDASPRGGLLARLTLPSV